jgi:2-dehydropantoate 2-reductase
VVPLQNGVEASELLAPALGDDRVLGAVARVICWADPPGEIHQLTPVSLTIGARRPGVAEAVESCAQVLRSAGAEVLTTERIDRARWTKFLFIVPYSAVGAVERAPAGGIRTSPRARARLEGAMREIAALAAARGVELAAEIVAQTMARVDEVPADATASMHRDIVAGRPSELDELIGAVVRLGRASGVPTPVSDALYAELEPLERKARAGR